MENVNNQLMETKKISLKNKSTQNEIDRKIEKFKEQGFIVKYNWVNGFELLGYNGDLEVVEVPDGIECIGYRAFVPKRFEINPEKKYSNVDANANPRIKKLILPDSVKEFSDESLKDIPNLEEIVLPRVLTTFPQNLFTNCPRLRKITTNSKKIELGFPDFIVNGFLDRYKVISDITALTDIKRLASEQHFSLEKEIIYHGIKLKVDMTKRLKVLEYENVLTINFDKPEEIVEYIDLNNPLYSAILRKIILSTPKDKLQSNVYDKYCEENFIKNIKLFEKVYSLTSSNGNLPREERRIELIADIFINNPNFLENSIEECVIKNYQFLVSQKIIDERILQSLYFYKNDDTLLSEDLSNNSNYEEIMADLLKYALSRSNNIPELLQTLVVYPDEANQLELLDRITYVYTMRLLDNPTSKKREQAIELLKRNNFENIVAIDRKDFELLTDGRYEEALVQYPIFDGIKVSLMTKLSGINEYYFDGLMRSLKNQKNDSKFKKFIASLSTIEHWDEFTDLKYRATCLKNEIVARIIYGLIEIKDSIGTLSEETILENLKNPFPSFDYILEKATGPATKLFSNENHIKILLKLDPYAFDALRSNPSIEDMSYKISHDSLEKKYIRTAARQGYVFDSQIKKKFGIQTPTKEKHLLEYINNEIGLAKVPEESKEEYLMRTRRIVQDYIKKNSETLLFDMIRATDLYMRSNNEYITQKEEKGEDIIITSKRVLDVTNTELSRVDRLLYCMYNFNKLAHNTLDINLKIEYINDRLGLREEEKNKFSNAIKAYNILSKYGLAFDIIKVFIDNDSRIKQELCGESNEYNDDTLVTMLNGFASSKQTHVAIKKEDIPEIKRLFSDISKLSKKDLDRIKIYAEEYSLFFETKEIIAEELIKSISTEVNQVVEQVIYLDEEGKKKYYQEHGYIIEVQLDYSGNYILACYSKAYKETFSIHIPNLSEELKNVINQKISAGDTTKTIAHTQLIPPGLTLSPRKNTSLNNTTYTQDNNSKITTVIKGFNIRTPKADVEYSIALENFISFDLYELQNEIKEKISRIDEMLQTGEYEPEEMARIIQYFNNIKLKDIFKEFPDILKKNKTIIVVTPTKVIENGIEKDGYNRIEVSMEEYLFYRLGIDKAKLNNFINEYGKLQLFQPTEQLPNGLKM